MPYKGMVEAHARRFTALPDMQNLFDDFVQEGLIGVWDALKTGHHPSNLVVTRRMSNLARTERRKGLGGYAEIPEELAA